MSASSVNARVSLPFIVAINLREGELKKYLQARQNAIVGSVGLKWIDKGENLFAYGLIATSFALVANIFDSNIFWLVLTTAGLSVVLISKKITRIGIEKLLSRS